MDRFQDGNSRLDKNWTSHLLGQDDVALVHSVS
eukprot:COSAG01_NODE_16123_length_1268_cov_1.117194_1_plen_32_part_10